MFTGVERVFDQDPGFGLRQLADIAMRALSSAVNDPTAAQCLERAKQCLAAVAHEPLGALTHRDRTGARRGRRGRRRGGRAWWTWRSPRCAPPRSAGRG